MDTDSLESQLEAYAFFALKKKLVYGIPVKTTIHVWLCPL